MDRDTLRRGIAAEVEVGDADWDEDGSWDGDWQSSSWGWGLGPGWVSVRIFGLRFQGSGLRVLGFESCVEETRKVATHRILCGHFWEKKHLNRVSSSGI